MRSTLNIALAALLLAVLLFSSCSPLRCPKKGKSSMQATDRLADTARWLRYAEEDLISEVRVGMP